MSANSSKLIRTLHLSGDLILINIAFISGYFIKFSNINITSDERYLTLITIFNFCWFVAAYILKTYDIYRVTRYENIISNLLRMFLLQTLLLTLFWVSFKAFYYSREQIMWTYVFLYPLVTSWRFLLVYFLKQYRKQGYNYRRIVVVGSGELAQQLIQVFNNNNHFGYKIVGIFSDSPSNDIEINGSVDELEAFCLANSVDEIYCSIADLKTPQVKQITEFSDNNLIRLKLLPDVRGFANRQLKIDFYEHIPVLIFRNIPLDDIINRALKRTFDVVFSLMVIVLLLSWLYPILAILIKANSKGPVLFKQKRSGKNNEEFWCWKFRTMVVNEKADQLQAKKDDNRITKLGAFLRKTSLDELPQFFNVLRGKMSVVGPRPHMLKHTEEYSEIINKYMVRHYVKPGITGLAQIKGFRGETKDPKMMENRVRMDMLYVENWSFWLDIKIILQTILNIFKKEEYAY
jgi:putative colanic acid biosysnthesis UDP-glucose lipid carrier transferase